ncbi:MAG TPA: OB-fold domain-containing protein [Polyangiaceae bacterium]|nr:OB-fold domain-containing protein [Polyangiaceae bacterium]
MSDEVLSARYVLEYTYTRSVGPIIGQFLQGLREGRIQGARTKSGRVIVPPTEYDPFSGEEIQELVDVGTSGVVKTWAWIDEPRATNPLQKPFAWALVQLDGADTALLHAVDVADATRMKTGMRVRARWAEERSGRIQDISCFEPETP